MLPFSRDLTKSPKNYHEAINLYQAVTSTLMMSLIKPSDRCHQLAVNAASSCLGFNEQGPFAIFACRTQLCKRGDDCIILGAVQSERLYSPDSELMAVEVCLLAATAG